MFEIPKTVRETYIQRRIEDVALLTDELARLSVDGFNRVGHQLSGNAANFGYTDLELIAADMETLTRKDLPEKGRLLLREFRKWVEFHAESLNLLPSSNDQ